MNDTLAWGTNPKRLGFVERWESVKSRIRRRLGRAQFVPKQRQGSKILDGCGNAVNDKCIPVTLFSARSLVGISVD
jgi:hypothetical protein